MSNADSMIELRLQFGARIREIRKEQNLTQTQLGLIAGLDRSQISRLECGHCSITLDTILLVADGLGISLSDLFAGVGHPSPASAEPPSAMLALPDARTIRYHVTEF